MNTYPTGISVVILWMCLSGVLNVSIGTNTSMYWYQYAHILVSVPMTQTGIGTDDPYWYRYR